jgi:outer membrane protein assembly factor BamA
MGKTRQMRRVSRRGSAAAIAVVVIAAFCPFPVWAGGSIEVRGVDALDVGRVRSLVALPENSPGPPSRAALERVQEAYFRLGYLGVRLTVTPGPNSTWTLDVEEGSRAVIATAAVGGELSRPRGEVMAALGLGPGVPYRPDVLVERMRVLLEEYDDAGHPFAQVWIDSLGYDAENAGVHIKLFVVEGSPRNIQRVEVEGLKKTRPELVVRIAGVEPGVPYRARLLRDAYARLNASEVFTHVEYPTVRLSPDGKGVDAVLVVDEPQRSHTFTSALGYADAEGEDDRQISGLVDLRLNNVGGTLRSLGAFWSNDGRDRVETRIDYRDQFFLGKRLSLGVRLHQVGLDTLYTWQSLGVEVERPVGRIGVSAGLHGDRNVFSEGELKRSWRARTSLGVRLRRDVADARWRGSVYTRLSVARKQRVLREGGDESLTQYIGEVESRVSVRLRPILHVRNELTYRGLESDERVVPLSELFYVGGARTLRGYKENQFSGRRAATARTELLLGRTRAENVYVFGDVGYVFRETLNPDDEVERDEIVRAGYGFGLRTRSRLGNVDLSFGVGEKLSLQQTKVHVLLEQNF